MRDAPKPLHGTPCVNLAIASKASVLDGLTVPTDAMKIKRSTFQPLTVKPMQALGMIPFRSWQRRMFVRVISK